MEIKYKDLKQLVIQQLVENSVYSQAYGRDVPGAEAAAGESDEPDLDAIIGQVQQEIVQASTARKNSAQALIGYAMTSLARAFIYAGASEEFASNSLRDLYNQIENMIKEAEMDSDYRNSALETET